MFINYCLHYYFVIIVFITMCGRGLAATLPPPSEWPHQVYLRADDEVKLQSHAAREALPFGTRIHFETDLFKGKFFLRLHNSDTQYFSGKKRLYQLVIQGQFKTNDLAFSDVVLGDVYDKPLKGVPKGRIGKVIKRFVEAISPGIIFDIFHDKQPKVLAPIGNCQTLSVDLPGDEPSDFNDISENTTLLCPLLGSSERRKRILSKPKSAMDYKINKDHVYTFEVYDNTMDFGTFHQHIMGGMKVDLIPSLDGQSLSLGMFTRKNLSCLFNFSMFHERAFEKTVSLQAS